MKHIYFTLLFFLLFSGISLGQNPGELDLTFTGNDYFYDNFGDPAAATIISFDFQSDGKIVAVGAFSRINGVNVEPIVRLNPDGSIENGFTPPDFQTYTYPEFVKVLADGKILVTGSFSPVNGILRGGILRLNPNGTIDNSFLSGSGFTGGIITDTKIQNGKIIVAGSFTHYNGTPMPKLARLNSDGSLDLSFTRPEVITGMIRDMEILEDGKIILAGTSIFTSNRGIARLNEDGSVDTTFAPTQIFDFNTVNDIQILNDGKIIVSGSYQDITNPVVTSRLARLNPDGNFDSSFSLGANADFVGSFLKLSNGKIVVSGRFITSTLTPLGNLILLNQDGIYDPSVNFGSITNGSISKVSEVENDKLLISGSFTTYKGVTVEAIARIQGIPLDEGDTTPPVPNLETLAPIQSQCGINSDELIAPTATDAVDGAVTGTTDFSIFPLNQVGTTLITWTYRDAAGNESLQTQQITISSNSGSLGEVDCSLNFKGLYSEGGGAISAAFNSTGLVEEDGRFYVGGIYNGYDGQEVNNIARFFPDGTRDASFIAQTNAQVYVMTKQFDGKIILGGEFTEVNGVPMGRIIRLNSDGSIDNSFNPGTGFNVLVRNLAVQKDGKIVVVGGFSTYQGVAVNRIVRLNTDGSLDTGFVPPIPFFGNPIGLGIQEDGKIVFGARVSSTNLQQTLFRLNPDGSADSSFSGTMNGQVWDLIIQDDGKIVIVGPSSFNGITINGIARINRDGSLDTGFDAGTAFGTGLARTVYSRRDRGLFVVGAFLTYQGQPMNRIVSINPDGSLDTQYDFGLGANDFIADIIQQPDGKLLVIGSFTSFDGEKRSGLVRLHAELGELSPLADLQVLPDLIQQCAVEFEQLVVPTANGGKLLGTTEQSIFPITAQGNTVITWTYDDGNGNTVTQQQTVIVDDTTAPVPALASLPTITAQCEATVTAPTANDTCEGMITGTTTDPTSYTEQGTYTITWTYDDGNGNIVTQEQTVIVDDTTAPVPTLASLPTITGQCEATVTAPTANDTCEGIIAGTTTDPTSYTEQGTYTITWTYDDGNGNTVTQEQTVIVDDTIAPVPTVGGVSDLLNPNKVDLGFNYNGSSFGVGANNIVYTIKVQPDGKILVGGEFTSFNGVPKNRLVRLNQDGTIDESFSIGSGANNFIHSIAFQPDGKVLIGGAFSSFNGNPSSGLARLNSDGSFDQSFSVGSGFNNVVMSIQIQPDGKILAGGNFSIYNGVGRTALARLNSNGSLDGSFIPAATGIGYIFSLGLQSDGKVLLGGYGFARLNTDGSLDSSFNTGSGVNDFIHSLFVDSLGRIVIVGNFTSYNGVGRSRVARILSKGTLDTSFNPVQGANNQVRTILPVGGEKYLIGGLFTTYNGVPKNYIAQINESGSLDQDYSLTAELNNFVHVFALQPGGKIIVGGEFTQSQGLNTQRLIRLINSDLTSPIPNLPDIYSECAVTLTAPTATDNCKGIIMGTTSSPLTYSEPGTYIITWTYDDGNGNTAIQEQTVIVDDTTAPVPTVAELPVISGQCAVEVTTPTANDACKGIITGTTTAPLTYTQRGTYQITWTYDDGNGNTSTQVQTVIVDDTIAPVPTVAELPVISGQCAVEVTAPTANDACKGIITGTTTDPTSYIEQGTYQITWTYDDGNGNTVTQQQTVIVDDTTAPVPALASLPTITAQCEATVTAPTANDTCEGMITGTTTDPTSYTEQGTYTITWTYDDGNGNIVTQEQTVIVDDTTAPVPTLASLPTITGQCEATVTAPTANDTCEGIIAGTTTDPTSYTEQGTYTITWTYDDGNGNTVTQEQTVIVDDTIAPVPTVSQLPVISGQCEATVTAPTATDTCEGMITGTTTAPLTYSQQGTYTITWTYDDGNGNTVTQQQTVIVDDTTAPVPALSSLPTITAQCEATVTAPTANDTCEGIITGTTTDQTSYTEQGTYTITWTYVDQEGNSIAQTQTIIIEDTEAPAVLTQDLEFEIEEGETLTISPESVDAGSFDNCGPVTLGLDKTIFTDLDEGQNIITLTVTDAVGNVNSAQATVTIIVNRPPTCRVVALANNLTVVLDRNGVASITTKQVNNGSFSECVGGSLIFILSQSTFSCSDLGVNQVTLTATDREGNVGSTLFTVTLVDNIVPTIAKLPRTVKVSIGSNTVYRVPDFRLTYPASDNCSVVSYTQNPAPGTVYTSAGVYPVTLTATDQIGNLTSGTFNIELSVTQPRGGGNNSIDMNSVLSVAWNTPFSDIENMEILMLDEAGEERSYPVTWNADDYDPLTPGFYQIRGTALENISFRFRPREEELLMHVFVEDKPRAISIELDSNTYPSNMVSGQVIGRLNTIDPVDDIHSYRLDNHPQISLMGDEIIWNGEEKPAASLNITVHSTDRAGQAISRELTLFRELGIGEFLIYPNPAEESTNVLVELSQPSLVSLIVYDAMGKIVISDQFNSEANFVQKLDLKGLAPGMYTVQIQIDKMVMNGRLIKK